MQSFESGFRRWRSSIPRARSAAGRQLSATASGRCWQTIETRTFHCLRLKFAPQKHRKRHSLVPGLQQQINSPPPPSTGTWVQASSVHVTRRAPVRLFCRTGSDSKDENPSQHVAVDSGVHSALNDAAAGAGVEGQSGSSLALANPANLRPFTINFFSILGLKSPSKVYIASRGECPTKAFGNGPRARTRALIICNKTATHFPDANGAAPVLDEAPSEHIGAGASDPRHCLFVCLQCVGSLQATAQQAILTACHHGE